ncbi:hypothetical protein SRHO_G00178860 [Serrasalmus rhombeus]
MSGDYRYPSYLKVVKRFWAINPGRKVEPVDLTTDPEYSGRTEYLEGGNKLFYFKLMNVTERDKHMYCIRITTDIEAQRYLFYPGVTLNVTGLKVESPEHVSEENMTRLTCRTTCPLPDRPTYICVRYSPKNVSVSISPSGEILEGSSVTLTCSCDANPPADEYSWFKQKQFIGKSKDYTISNISSEDGGEYKCKCSNAEGQRYSSSVTLNVVAVPSVVPYVAVVAALCGLAALLTVLIWCRRQKKRRDQHDYQNVDPNGQNDTYTDLQPTARSSDEVYLTLTNADPKAQDNTYTALQPTARSSDDVYHTLAAVQSISPDDPYTALDPQSRSPEYDTLAVSSTH